MSILRITIPNVARVSGDGTRCYDGAMRFSAGAFANALAWGVIVLLIGAAVLVVDRLGFMGLLLLGGATWLVCIRVELDQDVPTWGIAVFKAHLEQRHTPERKAAMLEDRRAFLSPLRFYGRCGVALAAAGLAGILWQVWMPG